MGITTVLTLVFLIVFIGYKILRNLWERLMLSDLNKRHVFITGCDTGFGHILAFKLASLRIPVIAACYTQKGANTLKTKVQGVGGIIETVQMDVTSQESVDRAAEFVAEKCANKGLWALVNNAGAMGANGPDDWLNIDDYKGAMDVNTLGVIRVTHALKDLVKQTKGRIVTVTSVMGRAPAKTAGPYCTSKYACEGYMDVLRQDMRPWGVSVHIIEPGSYQKTQLLDKHAVLARQEHLWERAPEKVRDEYGEEFFRKWKMSTIRLIDDMANKDPKEAAEAMFHAIAARFPRKRYPVGVDAQFFWIPLSLLPTILQDYVFVALESVYGLPAPAAIKDDIEFRND